MLIIKVGVSTQKMKTIWSGLESSGKSLRMAMIAERVAKRNIRWFKRSGIMRPIYSNMKFNDKFVELCDSKNVPIKYWDNLDQLIKVKDADVFIDEVGNYFDARMWSDLSLDVRRWLTQGAKSGVEIYGAAQDFAQIDLAFRRLVNQLWYVRKMFGSRRPSATRPPVKHIWGVCVMWQLNPQKYDEDKKEFATPVAIPRIFFIRKYFCDLFDTSQVIRRSTPMPFKHYERDCEDESCTFHKTIHA